MQQIFRRHPRLLSSALIGAAVFFLFPLHWSMISRILISWDCGVALFLILVCTWMARLSAQRIESNYADEDESAPRLAGGL